MLKMAGCAANRKPMKKFYNFDLDYHSYYKACQGIESNYILEEFIVRFRYNDHKSYSKAANMISKLSGLHQYSKPCIKSDYVTGIIYRKNREISQHPEYGYSFMWADCNNCVNACGWDIQEREKAYCLIKNKIVGKHDYAAKKECLIYDIPHCK